MSIATTRAVMNYNSVNEVCMYNGFRINAS
jgi:hypothetical protein